MKCVEKLTMHKIVQLFVMKKNQIIYLIYIRAGANAMKFDIEAEENKFSLTVGFLDVIETLGSHSDKDKIEIKLFKKDNKEE